MDYVLAFNLASQKVSLNIHNYRKERREKNQYSQAPGKHIGHNLRSFIKCFTKSITNMISLDVLTCASFWYIAH